MNTNKNRTIIMRGLEVKKDRLEHYKIIDCKNEKSNKLCKEIWGSDIIELNKHKKE